jgi:deoxyribonuclease-4
MANLGVHLSMGGGYEKAIAYAHGLGCTTVQIFTHNPRSFQFKPLIPAEIKKINDLWKQQGIHPIFSHCNYLINLGASENTTFYASVSAAQKELEYARAFGCDYFVLHVGKHKEHGLEAGMRQVAKAVGKLKPVLLKTKVTLLLETVAGQGTEIGVKFEELAQLIAMFDKEVQQYIGVTLDTCHIFAAGYDIRTKDGVERTVAEIERTFGLRRVKLIHVNDSKGELGDNLDRHEHLGKGRIGAAGLKAFLTHPKLRDIPMVIETPVDEDIGQEDDFAVLQGFFK